MRTLLISFLLCLITIGLLHADETDGLPMVRDFAADTGNQMPLVLMFAASDCGYCSRLEVDELLPVIRNGQYANRVRIRKISLDPGQYVNDFDGRRTATEEIASRYQVGVTPTVILLGPNGAELAERLVGIGTTGFYGAYLDRSIRQAEQRLLR
jgi:thioredoxin-related protein